MQGGMGSGGGGGSGDPSKELALKTLNEIRVSEGLQPFAYNSNLECSALAHAAYIVKNSVVSHDELAGKLGFTGKTPTDRGNVCGYKSTVFENLTFDSKDMQDALEGLLSAIYHRFTFLTPRINEIGVGTYDDGRQRGFVFNMGNSKLDEFCREGKSLASGVSVYGFCENKTLSLSKEIYDKMLNLSETRFVLYPHKTPSAVLFSGEIPDPYPTCKVTANPLSVEFVDEDVKMLSFRLFDAKGRERTDTKILSKTTDHNKKLTARQFALFSREVFDFGAKYKASFVYMGSDGQKREIEWNFETMRPSGKYFVVHGGEKLQLKVGESYTIFLKPRNCNDLMGSFSVRYAGKKADVTSNGTNTIRVKFNEDSANKLEITFSNGKKIWVEKEK